MLRVSQLHASYGAITAVRDISLTVESGQLVAMLGANGAGKSTLMKSLAGWHRGKKGEISLKGQDIGKWPTHRIVRGGMALVPEGRHVIESLTVAENLALSRFAGRGNDAAALERVLTLFPRLAERLGQAAGLMSGGEQQMLAMGRALMTSPDLLLLDEPSMGLAPSVIDAIYDAIKALHEDGLSILLVEQDATRALDVADWVYLLQRGQVRHQGLPAEVAATDEIKLAYLG